MSPSHTLGYAANCSMLFTEWPLLERPAAARAAGFEAIEFWWPWPATPVPPATEVERFVRAVQQADVELIGLNFFAGDLAGADCGVLSIPSRTGEFTANLDVALEIGERLHVPAFNALYGNRVPEASPEEQDELGTAQLVAAAAGAARIGATVLVEPISGPKPYPLRTADDVATMLARVRAAGASNVAFLCDLFHLANNGDDVAAAIERHHGLVGHVQVADWPGRGEPGSGGLDLGTQLVRLQELGYPGRVALEYQPTTDTLTSLTWLPRDRRGRPHEE